jgi:hypothetical protein
MVDIKAPPLSLIDNDDNHHNLFSSPHITRTIKSRGMRWPGVVARVGEIVNAYMILVGKSEGNIDHVEDLDIEGKITFK